MQVLFDEKFDQPNNSSTKLEICQCDTKYYSHIYNFRLKKKIKKFTTLFQILNKLQGNENDKILYKISSKSYIFKPKLRQFKLLLIGYAAFIPIILFKIYLTKHD